jgi:hypothetical protein
MSVYLWIRGRHRQISFGSLNGLDDSRTRSNGPEPPEYNWAIIHVVALPDSADNHALILASPQFYVIN